MLNQLIFTDLVKDLSTFGIVSIYGQSGTGKTTLAIQLVSQVLQVNGESSCIWIQANDVLPIRRLNSVISGPSINNKLIKNKIFTIPPNRVCSSYFEQEETILNISNENIFLPPEAKIIVIDNISYHLRYQLSLCENFQERSLLLNKFFNEQLFSLIMFCQREQILLILLHEVSYNVKLNETVPFSNQLFSRIQSLMIRLNKSLGKSYYDMDLSLNDKKISIAYKIEDIGLVPK